MAFVAAAYTLQLDDDNKAVRVTDSKLPARDLFLGHNELPKPGGRNPLREAWNGGYAVEVFYFPASSLKITNILRYLMSIITSCVFTGGKLPPLTKEPDPRMALCRQTLSRCRPLSVRSRPPRRGLTTQGHSGGKEPWSVGRLSTRVRSSSP